MVIERDEAENNDAATPQGTGGDKMTSNNRVSKQREEDKMPTTVRDLWNAAWKGVRMGAPVASLALRLTHRMDSEPSKALRVATCARQLHDRREVVELKQDYGHLRAEGLRLEDRYGGWTEFRLVSEMPDELEPYRAPTAPGKAYRKAQQARFQPGGEVLLVTACGYESERRTR